MCALAELTALRRADGDNLGRLGLAICGNGPVGDLDESANGFMRGLALANAIFR